MLQWSRSTDTFSSALSSQWARRNGGTNPLTSSGVVTATSTGFYPAEFIARRASGRDQYAAITFAQPHPGTAGGSSSCLFLRSPNSSTSGTVPVAFIGNNAIGIYTMTSWAAANLTVRAAYAQANGGSPIAVGSRIEFFVISNVFYVYNNGALVNSWADTTAVASQTGRYGGLIMQNASDGTATGAQAFDDFVFGDLRPVEIPTPMQSMNRSASF